MKYLLKNSIAAFIIVAGLGITACGGGAGNGSTAPKVDTVINPPDNTSTQSTDSTLPSGAVGVDTVAGGKSSSSGVKDTTKHR